MPKPNREQRERAAKRVRRDERRRVQQEKAEPAQELGNPVRPFSETFRAVDLYKKKYLP